MRDMLRGLHKFGTPAMCLGMVDVRDVAKAHVEAAIRPDAEGRFLLVADSKTFLEAGQILRERLGNKYPFPKSTLPNLLFYVIGLTQGLTWKVVRANAGYRVAYDNARSREVLGIEHIPAETTLVEQAKQQIEAHRARR